MEYNRKHFLINFTQCNVMLIFEDFQHIFFFQNGVLILCFIQYTWMMCMIMNMGCSLTVKFKVLLFIELSLYRSLFSPPDDGGNRHAHA